MWYGLAVAAFTLEFSICIALHCGDVRCREALCRAVPCRIPCERSLTDRLLVAADNELEPQALPGAPGERVDDGTSAVDRGRRGRAGSDAGQPAGEELHQGGQHVQGEGRREGGGRDSRVPHVPDDEARQPGLLARGVGQDFDHRLHGHDEGTRGPAARPRNPHREKGEEDIVVCPRHTAASLLVFYRAMHYSAKRGRVIAYRLSLRLSACL